MKCGRKERLRINEMTLEGKLKYKWNDGEGKLEHEWNKGGRKIENKWNETGRKTTA